METCRFCLENESVEKMISPCKCSGSQKYVHIECVTKWQEAKLKNAFSDPELYDLSEVCICNVCKSEYNIKSVPKYWKLAKFASPVFKFTQKYWYSLFLILIILILFSGVLLIPVVLNTIVALILFFVYCHYKGIRPRIIVSDSEVRIGFIRFGHPVESLKPGVLIQATEVISSGIFAESIVLITAYSVEQGAVGFIINKRISKI